MPMGSPMPSPTDRAMGIRPMPSPLVRGSSALATLPTARHMVIRLQRGQGRRHGGICLGHSGGLQERSTGGTGASRVWLQPAACPQLHQSAGSMHAHLTCPASRRRPWRPGRPAWCSAGGKARSVEGLRQQAAAAVGSRRPTVASGASWLRTVSEILSEAASSAASGHK